MTITFTNDNKVIVYAIEKIISHARTSQQIFVAQCVWWLASIIGLEQGLASYINTIQSRVKVTVSSEKVSEQPVATPEESSEERQDRILRESNDFLRDSRRLRKLAALKKLGKTKTGRINPLATTKQALKVSKKKDNCTEEIAESEIQRRKVGGECLRFARPSDRKGAHRVTDCIWPIKLDKGTASYPKDKRYQQVEISKSEISIYETSSMEEDSSVKD